MELPKDAVRILEAGYAAPHRIYEVCGVAATTLTGTWLAFCLAQTKLHVWWLPCALVLGMAGADLVSGIVHWGFDTWGTLETPVVGRLVIRAFRQHHLDPRAMLAHDFIETNGHNFMLAITLTGSGLWLVDAHAFIALTLLTMAFFVAVTSQIHKWAHMEQPPGIVRWLQRARLVLPRDHHDQHHLAPYLQNYCITVGWLDGLLRKTRAFGHVERLVTWMTGVRPRRHDPRHG